MTHFSEDSFRNIFTSKLVGNKRSSRALEAVFVTELGFPPETLARICALLSGISPTDLMLLCAFLKGRPSDTYNQQLFGVSAATKRDIIWETCRQIRLQLFDNKARCDHVCLDWLQTCSYQHPT